MYRYVPFILFFSSLIVALFHPFSYSYLPFVIICVLFGTAVLLKQAMKKATVSVELLSTKNKHVPLQMTFHKTHRIALQGTYSITCQHSISGQQQQFQGAFKINKPQEIIQIPTQWQHCGQLQIIEASVTYTDTLAWTRHIKQVATSQTAILWPIKISHYTALSNSSQFSLLGQDGGAKERFIPYMPGDAVRDIHWALSAKMQQTIVQKHAYSETKSEQIALYFNDVQTIEQYDAFMNECFSLLQTAPIDTVYVWTGNWQAFPTEQYVQIDELFRYLLQQPLTRLYADCLPEHCKIIRYERVSQWQSNSY